jgi:hypothetical protein
MEGNIVVLHLRGRLGCRLNGAAVNRERGGSHGSGIPGGATGKLCSKSISTFVSGQELPLLWPEQLGACDRGAATKPHF